MKKTQSLCVKYIFVSPVLMWLLVAFGVLVFVKYGNLHRAILNKWLVGVFFIALIYWITMFVSAVWVHRNAARSAAGIGEIVDRGIYSKVRHPIYSADIILSWGIVCLWPATAIIMCAIWATTIFVLWAFIEEWAMIEKFGKKYEEYRRKTPMFLPR